MEFDGIIDGMISEINNEIKWNGINLIEQWAGYGRPHAIQFLFFSQLALPNGRAGERKEN